MKGQAKLRNLIRSYMELTQEQKNIFMGVIEDVEEEVKRQAVIKLYGHFDKLSKEEKRITLSKMMGVREWKSKKKKDTLNA